MVAVNHKTSFDIYNRWHHLVKILPDKSSEIAIALESLDKRTYYSSWTLLECDRAQRYLS